MVPGKDNYWGTTLTWVMNFFRSGVMEMTFSVAWRLDCIYAMTSAFEYMTTLSFNLKKVGQLPLRLAAAAACSELYILASIKSFVLHGSGRLCLSFSMKSSCLYILTSLSMVCTRSNVVYHIHIILFKSNFLKYSFDMLQ